MSDSKSNLFPLDAIRPSQFYLSKTKLENVLAWFDPADLSNFVPVPLIKLNGEVIFTDGHTRAAAAYLSGLNAIPFVWDEDDQLDLEAYSLCVQACKERGIYSIKELSKNIVLKEDYETLWYGWCDSLHRMLQKRRGG